MNCKNHISVVDGIEKTINLAEFHSGKSYQAKLIVSEIEKKAGKTFVNWKSLKEYYIENLQNQEFNVKYNNEIIDCKSIIEHFCFIEVVENTWIFASDQFESIIRENYKNINFTELYNYMVQFSEPEISIGVYFKQQHQFISSDFDTEKYLESLCEWLFIYTMVNKNSFAYDYDPIYERCASTMIQYLDADEIEFWIGKTIKKHYGDSIWESYWYWLRTLVIFYLCKNSHFRLSKMAFEAILNEGLREYSIDNVKELGNLDEFYCVDELAAIILYHNYQSPMADCVLYFKKVRDRLISEQNYDDLKLQFEKLKCNYKKPEGGWSVKIPKSNPDI